MCNLYTVRLSRAEVAALFRHRQLIGTNFRDAMNVYPNGDAPVVVAEGDNRIAFKDMRWGFPKPPNIPGGGYVFNVRNTGSNFWKPWLKKTSVKVGNDVGGRCLVPGAPGPAIAEPRPSPMWLAHALFLPDDRPCRCGEADPREGDAADPHEEGRNRDLADRPDGRGEMPAKPGVIVLLPLEAKAEGVDKPAGEPATELKRAGRPLKVANPRDPDEVAKALGRSDETKEPQGKKKAPAK